MSLEMMLYLAGISKNVWGLVFGLGLLFLGMALFIFLFALEDGIRSRRPLPMCVLGICFLLLSTVIPPERSIYLMMGAHAGKEMIPSETGKKVHNLLDAKLDELLKTTQPKGE